MRRRLSTRFLALLSLSLAVASLLFGLQWVSREVWRIERRARETMVLEAKQENLEHQLLNLGALVMKSSEEPPRLSRIEPPRNSYAKECATFLDSSPTLFRTMETARSEIFQIWYYEQMKKRYFNNEVR